MNKVFLALFLFSVTRCITNQEKNITIISCFYNTSATIIKTLDSLFSQKYNNVHIILIDDASTDDTPQQVKQYLQTKSSEKPCTFIRTTSRKRKLANLYAALHACKPDSIILLVDGDDWLKNDTVLSYLNDIYQDESVWMTYGEYENVPKHIASLWGIQEKSYCAPITNQQNIRQKPFIFMHPRSFYAWLFQLIPLSELISETIPGFQGDFFPAGNDMALFFPMVELAGEHVHYLQKIVYCRNVASPIVGFKVDHCLQKKAGEEIRKRTPLPLLAKKKYHKKITEKDIAVFGLDSNKSLKQCCYIAWLGENDTKKIHKKNLAAIAHIIEITGAPFCFISKKPTRAIPFLTNNQGIFYVWKRSLNNRIPFCDSCIIKKSVVLHHATFPSPNPTQAVIDFFQSKEYDIGLSFMSH
jgi:glycosyltransferase involved in cell wall biosynthesis